MSASRRFALIAAATIGLCSTPVVRPAHAANASVGIANFSFSPATVTIDVGNTVTWTNNQGSHGVQGDGGIQSSAVMAEGTSYSRTFNSAGTYNYRCTVHSSMTGKVVVQSSAPATTAAPPPTQTPTTTRAGSTTNKSTTTAKAASPTAAAGSSSTQPGAVAATGDAMTTTSTTSTASSTTEVDESSTEVATDEASSGNSGVVLLIFALAIVLAAGMGALLWRRRGATGESP